MSALPPKADIHSIEADAARIIQDLFEPPLIKNPLNLAG
jgi:hypothetical protein